MTVMGR